MPYSCRHSRIKPPFAAPFRSQSPRDCLRGSFPTTASSVLVWPGLSTLSLSVRICMQSSSGSLAFWPWLGQLARKVGLRTQRHIRRRWRGMALMGVKAISTLFLVRAWHRERASQTQQGAVRCSAVQCSAAQEVERYCEILTLALPNPSDLTRPSRWPGRGRARQAPSSTPARDLVEVRRDRSTTPMVQHRCQIH
jgi:hypothetical protein